MLGVNATQGAMPPQTSGISREEVAGRIAVLEAQLRAQHAALAVEKIALEEASEDFTRAEASYEQKTISAEEMSRKKFALRKSQARLQQMEAELATTDAEHALSKAQLERGLTPGANVPLPPTPSGNRAPAGAVPVSPSGGSKASPAANPNTPAAPPATSSGF
jgi:hypothetical protein